MRGFLSGLSNYFTKETKRDLQLEIIDESNSSNILSDKTRSISLSPALFTTTYSQEGFSHSPEMQKKLAYFLINELNLKDLGSLFDVGYGNNLYIAETFNTEQIPSYAIDLADKVSDMNDSLFHPPKFISIENGVNLYNGDIAYIDMQDSVLKDNLFGTILFNGSWRSGGNNWTVGGEMIEGKYHSTVSDKQKSKQTKTQFIEDEKENILHRCKNHLDEDGTIGVISSRYAYHGAGWSYTDLPEEKLSFIELYNQFHELGAKKICLVGVSQGGFDEIIENSKNEYMNSEYKMLSEDDIYAVRQQLQDVDSLPKEDSYSKYAEGGEYRKKKIVNFLDATKDVSELNSLARIDAIFAYF